MSGIIGGTIITKYEVDRKTKIIKLTEESGKSDLLKYVFQNNILTLEMQTEEGFIKLGFVKV